MKGEGLLRIKTGYILLSIYSYLSVNNEITDEFSQELLLQIFAEPGL